MTFLLPHKYPHHQLVFLRFILQHFHFINLINQLISSTTMGLLGTSDPVKKEEKLIEKGESTIFNPSEPN